MTSTTTIIRVTGSKGVAKARHIGYGDWLVIAPRSEGGLRRFRVTGSSSQIRSALRVILN